MLLSFIHSVLSSSLRCHGLQQARPPCPSPSPESLPKFMFIALVMPSNHLILCCPLLLLPSIFPTSGTFPISHLCTSDGQNTGASAEYSGLITLKTDWFEVLAVQGTFRSLLQHHSPKASMLWCSAFFVVQLSQL